VFFKRRKPVALMGVKAWKETVPRLNRIWLQLDARSFDTPNGQTRLTQMSKLIEWSDAAYATMSHPQQLHDRMAQRTPQERLDWLTFFGPPYLKLLEASTEFSWHRAIGRRPIGMAY
jgi:hypothetical protein